MYRTEGVLVLLALYVGLTHSFSWDVVVAGDKQLEFYDNNGTRTHIEDIASLIITSLAYDPVHNRVLFAQRDDFQNCSICSFEIATRKTIFLVESDEFAFAKIAYDPATQTLFWSETGWRSKNSILSKPAYTTAVEQNILKNVDGLLIHCITVDHCERYIYWATDSKIERARFDGSERKLVIVKNSERRLGLAIDHQTQKMYWIDNLYSNRRQMTVESADLNGENRRILYVEIGRQHISEAKSLVVSKDYIYWRTRNTFSQLTKNQPYDKETGPKQFMLAQSSYSLGMAFNYKIEDQNSETDDCTNVSTDASLLCVHGTKVYGESRCECTQGYIGERCEVSVCQNYCFQGDCNVTAEGHPKCRCNAGCSGERCEINVNNTLKGWRIDMDHAMAKFTDDIIKGTLRGLREEIEISIMSKLNASIKFTLSDMKQEMNNTLRCSDHEKLKESVRTVAHDVSRLKSPVQFQAAEQKEL